MELVKMFFTPKTIVNFALFSGAVLLCAFAAWLQIDALFQLPVLSAVLLLGLRR